MRIIRRRLRHPVEICRRNLPGRCGFPPGRIRLRRSGKRGHEQIVLLPCPRHHGGHILCHTVRIQRHLIKVDPELFLHLTVQIVSFPSRLQIGRRVIDSLRRHIKRRAVRNRIDRVLDVDVVLVNLKLGREHDKQNQHSQDQPDTQHHNAGSPLPSLPVTLLQTAAGDAGTKRLLCLLFMIHSASPPHICIPPFRSTVWDRFR